MIELNGLDYCHNMIISRFETYNPEFRKQIAHNVYSWVKAYKERENEIVLEFSRIKRKDILSILVVIKKFINEANLN